MDLQSEAIAAGRANQVWSEAGFPQTDVPNF